MPPFLSVRQALPLWGQICSDQELLRAIEKGVHLPLHSIPRPLYRAAPKSQEQELENHVLDSVARGVCTEVSPEAAARTRFWVPIKGVPKRDSGKLRLITEFPALNQCYPCEKYKPDSWKTVQQLVSNPNLTWGLTLDLKDFFHHLSLDSRAQRWARFWLRGRPYQCLGLPFGLKSSPFWAHRLAKPLIAWARGKGWQIAWYVDDLLLLGESRQEVLSKACQLVALFSQLGIQIHQSKWTRPSQMVTYLGQVLDLQRGLFCPLPSKFQVAQRLARKAAKAKTIVPQHLARLAGVLLDLQKSCINLVGQAQILMRYAGKAAAHAQATRQCPLRRAWCLSTPKPPLLKAALQHVLHLMKDNPPTPMRVPVHAREFRVETDASEVGWGGALMERLSEVATAASRWGPSKKNWHSTHLEAKGASNAILSVMPHIPPKSRVILLSDSTPTVYATQKGTANPVINECLRLCRTALAMNGSVLLSQHKPGRDNTRADFLSRMPDHHDYEVKPEIFRFLVAKFGLKPEVDLFANRRNRKCREFFSWRMDVKAKGQNALLQSWKNFTGWCNPPWEIIPKVLAKIARDEATVLALFPKWPKHPWWPQFLSLVRGPLITFRGALYKDPLGKRLPAPRWKSVGCVLQG